MPNIVMTIVSIKKEHRTNGIFVKMAIQLNI
jgi:hypothetical protein